MFALKQRTSLLLAQQDAHVQTWIGSFIAMFNIEIEQSIIDVVVATVDYMIFESMRIDVNQIVAHIKVQGSFIRACYELFEVDAQKTMVTKIVTYTMMLIVGLNGVKVERNNTN